MMFTSGLDIDITALLRSTGKSTLAKVLLRIIDFNSGALRINDVDIRKFHPDDYHSHATAVFQGFSKFNASVKENVGLGYIENLQHLPSIEKAIHLAEADALVDSLPQGIQTTLETQGFETITYPGMRNLVPQSSQRHGLSGGEVS
jgi:ABC-type multidrug transport system fused ATPase/permease subunit